jgi:hypothetical protein
MMRVSEIGEGSKRHLLVEGALSGEWVDVLEKYWLEEQMPSNGGPVFIDLSGVTWIDARGRELLARMIEDGAQLRATGVMIKAVIEGIIAGSASPEPCVREQV